MAKVSCSSTIVERKPRAYINTHTGDIIFPLGLFSSATVVMFHAEHQLLESSPLKFTDFEDLPNWIPIYDGDTLKIAFGESNE